ncbi:hypothetical protein DY000_02024248 [Brassica cretica]|uniref:Uncharacterized protein n=1 Tax=Brassica cretica TaxID=69181 RepID=A0ABQ7EDU3_BRACR|nr:hypothetical protein DY000_02024248 [Brassica cretica]
MKIEVLLKVWLVLFTSKALQLLSLLRGVVISSNFFVELDDGLELSFAKKRRFAIDLELSLSRFSKVRFLVKPVSLRPILEIGHDALLEPMTVVDLLKAKLKCK